MKNGIETEDWRKKYFDSLRSLETEQRQFHSTEASLRRLAGRLCTAALGQSSRLDDEIRKLQKAIRREATGEELDEITPALSDAIQALDQTAPVPPMAAAGPAKIQPVPAVAALKMPPAAVPLVVVAPPEKAQAVQPARLPDPPPREPSIDEERIRAILAALLAELRRDPELLSQVDAIDSKLNTSPMVEQLPEVLSALAEIVGRRIQRIERSKQEVEDLLSQMVGKLDEVSQFVAEQNQNQSQSQASSETLNTQLVGEMRAMGESVDASDDLQMIRTQVRGRLASIDRHLQEFRQREATRAVTMRTRNDKMRARVAELEAEASRLHNQLKDEQRLSTIDVLTKVPNRLAYEKRIEEELQRWQRFRQPTCLSVWDVDHFKRINDGYGHRAGDRVLSTVAECLAERIRGTDFLARYGGEEFVLILPGTILADAVRVIDELRIAISKIGFHFRGTPLSVTISTGVTELMTGDSANAAFDRADKAMYRAKEGGRNRCVGV